MLNILKQSPIIPVVVIERLEHAVPLAKAVLAGGISILEVTLRTPIALEAISSITKALPEMIVGAGTILLPTQFQQAKQAGAQFAVSPGYNQELVAAARSEALPYLPGIATISEAMHAYTAGFKAVKFFPASAFGGARTIAAYAAVLPQLSFCPTGGINLSNLAEYLELSAIVSVGGTWLTPPQLIMQQDWNEITALTRQALLHAQSARTRRTKEKN